MSVLLKADINSLSKQQLFTFVRTHLKMVCSPGESLPLKNSFYSSVQYRGEGYTANFLLNTSSGGSIEVSYKNIYHIHRDNLTAVAETILERLYEENNEE